MINLLPPKEKENLIREKNRRLLLATEIIILIFLVVFSAALFLTNNYILSRTGLERVLGQEEKQEIDFAEAQKIREEISANNKEIADLNNFFQNQASITGILEKISKKIVPGVYLTSFSYRKNSEEITISGFSLDRENLLDFKKNLESEFREVYFPAATWIIPKEIDFNATFKF